MKKILFFAAFLFLPSHGVWSQSSPMQQAADLYKSGNYEGAEKIFEKLIDAGTIGKEAYDGGIDCAMQMKHYARAISLVEKTITRFGPQYSYELLLARLFHQNGNTTQAISRLLKLRKIYPDSAAIAGTLSDLYMIQGGKLYKQNKATDAIVAFRSALTYDPNNQDARKNYLILLLHARGFQEAVPVIKEAFTMYPEESLYRQMYAEAMIGQEKYDDALKTVELLVKTSPDDLQLHLKLAMLYRFTQKADRAFETYAALRSKFPESREVYLAEIDLLQLYSRHDTIIARCREFLRHTPGDKDMMLGMAKQYEDIKSYDTARTIYAEMIQKDIYRDAALLSADCSVHEGRTDVAIQELQTYVNGGGKNVAGFLRLSELLNNNGMTDSAQRVLLWGIERLPLETQLYINSAKLYFFGGIIDSAEIRLSPVKAAYSDFPEISYLYGRICALRNDKAKAVFHFTRCIRTSLRKSQTIQAQALSSITGNNLTNPDSIDKAEKSSLLLDTLTKHMKDSFTQLKRLSPPAEYLSALNDMIAEMPQAALLYNTRALYFAETGMQGNAAEDFESALSFAPTSEEVHRDAGEFYSSHNMDEKAFAVYQNALSLNKKVTLYYAKVIALAVKLDKLHDVCDYWMHLYEADTTNVLLKEHLIEALHKAGRFDEAGRIIKDTHQ